MPSPRQPDTPPETESPRADDMQGAAGTPHATSGDDRPVDEGDQDIDTAGTDHDDESPTKNL